jgi:arylsulfatase A-like enzyme
MHTPFLTEKNVDKTQRVARIFACVVSLATISGAALAQQVTGTLGSPSATTTLSGKQLPAPEPAFGGVIKDDALQSKPWWPPRVVPPKGAPNVLLIMTDDAGFAVPSTFGGVIPTPTMDRIAASGLRYNRIFSTALCSPTRAALITGRNHHSVGFGVIAEQATGFPGYDSVIGVDNATIGRILRDNGYATSWFGKDHNTPTYQASQVGPFTQWPTGMGFDYFYGFVGGDANQWGPNLFRNTTQIYPWLGHEGTLKMDRSDPKAEIWPVTGKEPSWNLITAMADDALDWMYRIHQTDPRQPIFIWYVPGASHAPHHPTREWVDKIHAMHLFDDGYEKVRERIFANQKKLGVIPQDEELTPWPNDLLTPWDKLTPEAKKLYIRQVEVFAAYVAYSDHEIGRVIQGFEDFGKLDNTLIIYQNGDNGTSAEGGPEGTFSEVAFFNGVRPPVDVQMKFYEAWGTEFAYNHMSAGWSWAFDTPFDWFKQNASRLGGINQNMVISWPARIKDKGGLREQFMHVIDVVPTLLEVTGIAAPETVDGIKQKPIEGTSFAYTFDAANAKEPSRHKIQYFEMMGQWALYSEGWLLSTKVDRAPVGRIQCCQRGSAQQPGVPALRPEHELQPVRRYRRAASGQGQRDAQDVRRGSEEVPGLPAGCVGGRQRRSAPSEPHRGSQRVGLHAADDRPAAGRCALPARHLLHPDGGHHRAGRRRRGHDRDFRRTFRGLGLLPAQGQAGVLLEPARSRAIKWEGAGGARRPASTRWNSTSSMTASASAPWPTTTSPASARVAPVRLKVDGKVVATKRMEKTLPIILQWDESFDIGSDTITGINDADYKPPFPLTAKFNKLTIKIDRPQLSPEDIKKLETAMKTKAVAD